MFEESHLRRELKLIQRLLDLLHAWIVGGRKASDTDDAGVARVQYVCFEAELPQGTS
jgi:hypothetical protein